MTDWISLIERLVEAHRQLTDLGHPPNNDDPLPDWTGPATEVDLRTTEKRLGVSLCGGYREYLATVNGQHLISDVFGPMFDCNSLVWFRNGGSDWIDSWRSGAESNGPSDDVSEADHRRLADDPACFRQAYLPQTLQIGQEYDGAVYLLNPLVCDESGEWETWCFANWYPGAFRHRSFEKLVRTEVGEAEERIRKLRLPFDRDAVLEAGIASVREIMRSEDCNVRAACSQFVKRGKQAQNPGVEAWLEREGEITLLNAIAIRVAGHPWDHGRLKK